MKIPWWKKYLSYFSEVLVESTSSEYNEALHVSLVDGRYQLTTPTAIYSWADKYENFTEIFRLINLDNPALKDVLILGFGLGSIPYMLEKKFKKKFRYTGVEIDEEVIYLASKYVLEDLVSDIQLVQADASTFIHIDSSRYDMIMMDVFIGHVVPDQFLSLEYLESMKESLTEDGVLLFNLLAQREDDKIAAQKYFSEVFKEVFPDASYRHIKGNMMLLSDQQHLKPT